jgi:hypothetical protein
MQNTWTPPLRWVFAAATVLGCFSALQSYRLSTLNLRYPMDIEVGKILILNLVYWYVPASLTPIIFQLGHRFRVDGPQWIRALGVHAVAAVGYSVVHCAFMISTRLLLWDLPTRPGNCVDVVRAAALAQLDFTLMTYTTVLGLVMPATAANRKRAPQEAQLERVSRRRLRTLEAELPALPVQHAARHLVIVRPDGANRDQPPGRLLRLTFGRSGAPRESFRRSWSFCRNALERADASRPPVGQVRHRPDTLDASTRLILQPLVETRSHGVAPKPAPALVNRDSAPGREPVDEVSDSVG